MTSMAPFGSEPLGKFAAAYPQLGAPSPWPAPSAPLWDPAAPLDPRFALDASTGYNWQTPAKVEPRFNYKGGFSGGGGKGGKTEVGGCNRSCAVGTHTLPSATVGGKKNGKGRQARRAMPTEENDTDVLQDDVARGGKTSSHIRLPDSDPHSFHLAFAQLSSKGHIAQATDGRVDDDHAHVDDTDQGHVFLGDETVYGSRFQIGKQPLDGVDIDHTGLSDKTDSRQATNHNARKGSKSRPGDQRDSNRAQCPVDSSIVNVIAKCLARGDTDSADMWMESVERGHRRISSKAFYNSLIHACGKAGNPSAAGWCAVRMVTLGLQPNLVTFNSILSACARAGDVQLATRWWKQMLSIGQRPNNITYNTMIKVCAQARDASSADMWVEEMISAGLKPCTVSFGTLTDVYAKIGQVSKAEEIFDRMEGLDVKPDKVIFNTMINACAKAGSAGKAQQWFERMKKSGFEPDEKTYNSLINACAKASNMDRAELWFEEMQRIGCKVDEITFGSIIHASAKVGNVERAGYWMDRMQAVGIRPNLVCFNTVLQACAHSGDLHGTQYWLSRMFSAGVTPNKITYNIMMVAYEKAGDHAAAEMWIRRMIAYGHHPDQITYATLLRARAGPGQNAQNGAEEPQDGAAQLAYQTLVKVYAELGQFEYTKNWLTSMLAAGYKPTRQLYEAVLNNWQAEGAAFVADQDAMRRICSMLASACDETNGLLTNQTGPPTGRNKGRGESNKGKGKGSGRKGGNRNAGRGSPMTPLPPPLPSGRPLFAASGGDQVEHVAEAAAAAVLAEEPAWSRPAFMCDPVTINLGQAIGVDPMMPAHIGGPFGCSPMFVPPLMETVAPCQ